MRVLGAAVTSRYAGWGVVLLAGLAACQGVELGVGVKPAIPPPDPAVVKQVEDANVAVAEAERKAKEAGQLAADAEASRAAAVANAADLEREVAAGKATQDDLDRARRRATEAAAEATQAKGRADRARAWTDDFSTRVTTANDRLTRAEAAWRDAAGAGLNAAGPKDTTPWGLLSWAMSTGLLVVLNEKRKREARAVLEEAKREGAEVVTSGRPRRRRGSWPASPLMTDQVRRRASPRRTPPRFPMQRQPESIYRSGCQEKAGRESASDSAYAEETDGGRVLKEGWTISTSACGLGAAAGTASAAASALVRIPGGIGPAGLLK